MFNVVSSLIAAVALAKQNYAYAQDYAYSAKS
jgi:hypothetical protein